MTLIRLENLSLGYNGRAVVKNVNAVIEEGDFVCIVGPNGAGKTTLVKGMLGLIAPMSGKIIRDKDETIGYMPQENAISQNFPATVKEIVLSGTLGRKKTRIFYGAEAKKIAQEAMRKLKIENLSDKSFADLSGGQKQKVFLARGLAASDKLLILDEPSNNLDSGSRKEFYRTLEKLNKKTGITIIMITHDLDHGNLIGNKILALTDTVFFGTTAEYVRKVHHE